MKQLLFVLISMLPFTSISQEMIFNDDFEGYAVDQNLATSGYRILNANAVVANEEDNKYARVIPTSKGLFFQKKITLDVGKTYEWSVSVKRSGTTNFKYVMKVVDGSGAHLYDSLHSTNDTEWQINTLKFQVISGAEEAILSLYQWTDEVDFCVDNFRLEDTQETGAATTRLPGLFGDNMVLQRETDVNIWGKDDAGVEVAIHTSWDDGTYQTVTNENGDWKLIVSTPAAGGPYSIRVSGTETLEFENVMIGEVWLTSGQSNMNMKLGGEVEGATQAISSADNPMIRYLSVSQKGSLQEQDMMSGVWEESSSTTAAGFSAVSYFFARTLQDSLQIPVGIINASYGGSKIEAWMDGPTLETFDFVELPDEMGTKENTTPTALYNAMINPLVGFGMKGVLWYQGEGNRQMPEEYSQLFPAMIQSWRDKWEMGSYPFYYVQLAPFDAGESVMNFPFWDMQRSIMNSVENTGMVVTLDVGDCDNVHPAKKEEVGDRLAYWALGRDYDHDIVFSGPLPIGYSMKSDTFFIHFDHPGNGLVLTSQEGAFELADAQGQFFTAMAQIKVNGRIAFTNASVESPSAVRYGYGLCEELSPILFNMEGLPASPFMMSLTDSLIVNNSDTLNCNDPKNDCDTTNIELSRVPIQVLNFYPNPVESFLIVEGLHDNVSVSIISPAGMVMKSRIHDQKVDFSGLKSGLYFLKIEGHDPVKVMKM